MRLPEHIVKKLRAHQVEPAERLLNFLAMGTNCIDMGDMGIGKTYIASAATLTTGRPTLVVAPKIATSSWHEVAEYLGGKLSVINYEKLRTGRTPFGWWDHTPEPGHTNSSYLVCENCQRTLPDNPKDMEPCYTNLAGIHCVTVKKHAWRYGQFHFAPQIGQLVFDEAHRCGALDSLNADMLIAAARDKIPTLAITATPACSPLHLRALGFLLGLHSGHDYFSWATHLGCRRIPRAGFKWMVSQAEQSRIMASLRSQIIPSRGVRITTAEIPGFPAVTITPRLYDLEEGGQIDKLYAKMAHSLEALKKHAEGDKSADHPLTIILRARQKIELLMVPIVVERASDCLENGESVAIFANFRQTLDELSQRLKCDMIVDGSPDGVVNRQRYLARFQANDDRLILLNSEAGGIALSLHDLHGEHPRRGLVLPGYSAVTFKQLLGRLARDGGKTPAFYEILFAAKTIQTKVYSALKAKLTNMSAFNDEWADVDMNPLALHYS